MPVATVPRILPDDTARTRRADPTTSHEAADTNDIAASSAEVLWLLKSSGPMADHELIAAHDADYGWSEPGFRHFTPQRLRTARAELTESGAVEFTGIYRLTPSGRRAQVWAVTA